MPTFHTENVAEPRSFSPAEVQLHNHEDDMWAVIDGFVVDASGFASQHPGGTQKLLSANYPETGATGRNFGFSFSKGRNGHFPHTGATFEQACTNFLSQKGCEGGVLAPHTFEFREGGSVTILGVIDLT
jgi:hypothetical protein